MKRKIVRHGSATLSVSLPLKWAKHHNLDKGEEVEVDEQPHALIIKPCADKQPERKQFNIDGLKRVGTAYLTSSYREGFDEIEFFYDDPAIMKWLQEFVSQQIVGFEIVKQSSTYCLVKDMSGVMEESFDVALRRLWLLVLSMAEDCHNAITKKDKEQAKSIEYRDQSVNKFANYCCRLLLKKGHCTYKKTPIYFHTILNLEHLADEYKNLAKFYFEFPQKLDKPLLKSFEDINKNLNQLYRLFYKFDPKQAEQLFKDTKANFPKLNKTIISGKNSSLFASYLFSISKRIRKLISSTIEIKV